MSKQKKSEFHSEYKNFELCKIKGVIKIPGSNNLNLNLAYAP